MQSSSCLHSPVRETSSSSQNLLSHKFTYSDIIATTQYRSSCIHRVPASADPDPPRTTSDTATIPKKASANQHSCICQHRPRHRSSSYQIVSKSFRSTQRVCESCSVYSASYLLPVHEWRIRIVAETIYGDQTLNTTNKTLSTTSVQHFSFSSSSLSSSTPKP